MEEIGYIAAIAIGIILGLIGGGGSILTVPILVYLLGKSPVQATAYSLFVVGITSLVGAWTYRKKKQLSYRTAVVFAAPSLLAVFFTRKYLLPAIPEELFVINRFEVHKDMFIMVLFALLMIGAFISMVKKVNVREMYRVERPRFGYTIIIVQGLAIGVLTGLVGAGGGFLIIPALVILAKLPMKLAIGTSLLIIAINSLAGFAGNIGTQTIDWQFLLEFTGLAVLGIFAGSQLSTKISGEKLRPVFGWFILAMGIFIIIKEVILHI